MEMNDLLRETVRRGSSDLHLKSGRPPLFRTAGDLVPGDGEALDDAEVERLVRSVTPAERWSEFQETHESDFAYEIEGEGRFRFNLFKQLGRTGCVARLIPLDVPTIDGLELPVVLKDIVQRRQGVILVTGPTGSGKSTSLAAMIAEINETRPCHIVTIEDPVEFVYEDNVATISQRELGLDTFDPKEALKRALRQDPDIILMGEMRDIESMEMAMTAAETGHLVMSTLHTNSARQTVDRIIDAFPADRLKQLRTLLASTLLAVLSQRLLKRADGSGRIAAVEVMIASPRVAKLIYEGNTMDIERAIETSTSYYKMQTFNQCLAGMVGEGFVTAEEALSASLAPDDLKLILRGVKSGAAGLDALSRAEDEAEPETEPETDARPQPETAPVEVGPRGLEVEGGVADGGKTTKDEGAFSKLEVDRSFKMPDR